MITYTYDVCFESMTHPPETLKGTVEASTLPAAFARAVRKAKKDKPTNNRYFSILCIIQKPDSEAESATESDDTEGEI